MTYKVSIIMPAYNASKTIVESINCVLEQTYTNWELIIVNDGSTDNTLNVVEPFTKETSRIKLVNLINNGGLPNARNAGVESSDGNFIAFLDSDDLWLPDKLNCQVDFHREHPDCFISHTNFDAFDAKGKVQRPFKKFLEPDNLKKGNLLPGLYCKNVIGVLTVMMKRTVFEKVKGFDTSLWTLEDQDLWIRIAEKGYQFGYVDTILASYRISPNGISKTLGKYKKAQKIFITKHLPEISKNSTIASKASGNYYRHFGTAYFKKGEYKLANLYFYKSLQLYGVSFVSLTTIIYMLYGYFKRINNLFNISKA